MDFVRISAWSRLVRNSMAPAGLTLDFASGQQRSRGVAIALTLSGFLILGLAIDRSDTHKQQIAALESELKIGRAHV